MYPAPAPVQLVSQRPARFRLFAIFSLLIAMGIGMALTGCAGLPENVDRPVSRALADPSGTVLASMVQEQKAAAKARHPSGFVLLSGAQAAYSSRLALVESAQKTLDLQYYAIHADVSTQRLLQSVVAAAERGVRVRVLLDDLHSTGRDAQVMRLAFVPNVEMRMFNPLTGARNSQLGRIFSLVGDFSRVQQRMHNKLFIADNALGIAGGRNLGNAYFGNDDAGNFVDLDVLAAGPVVQELSQTFDAYWNNPRAYPVQSLISRHQLLEMQASMRKAAQGDGDSSDTPAEGAAPAAPAEAERKTTPEQQARIWNQEPMDLKAAPWTWAPAAVLVDHPAKIPAEGGEQPRPAPRAALPTAKNTPELASTDPQQDTVVDGLLQLMGQAKKDLLIVSPYFVPGPDMKQAFAAARARGVRVRVLTNSLASNDAPIAHAGYARHRPELLATGLELYEMRSELSGLRSVFQGTGSSGVTGSSGDSKAMLHSKLLILDGHLLVIGSMNLDLRSQLQNTEIALLIRSRSLSARATEQIEAALEDAAWQVEQDSEGRLVWRAPKDSGLKDATAEPDTSAPLRWLVRILGWFAPDHLL
ncbi:MAG: phospholipase D family protein [Acidovorax temperans]|uniref:phospholipase D family protein n=1 Tax=Acidovorax temperans TaxID=80878 RepID=UPI00391DA3F3